MPTAPSSSRSFAVVAIVLLVGGAVAVGMLRGGDDSNGKGREQSVAQQPNSAGGRADSASGNAGADRARDWQAGEHREAWEDGDRPAERRDEESISSFVAESKDPNAKERRQEKRRARAADAEDRADASGLRSPNTVFASDPGADYDTLKPSEPTELEDLTGESGTVSFWVTPAWDANSQDDTSFVSIGDGNIRVYKNVNFLRVEFTGGAGRKGSLGIPINDWGPGDAHQVTVTWDDDTHQMELFVDDKLVTQNVYDVGMKLDRPKMWLGSNEPTFRPIAPGIISRVEIRNRPMTTFNVSRRFHALNQRMRAER